MTERSFARLYEIGGMLATAPATQGEHPERAVEHASGFNLGLVMRKLVEVGKAKRLQGAAAVISTTLASPFRTGLMLLNRARVRRDAVLS